MSKGVYEAAGNRWRLGPSRSVAVRFFGIACLLGFLACSETAAADQPIQPSNSIDLTKKCHDAAVVSLGKRAQVLKCGFINDPNVLEVVAAIPKTPPKGDAHEVFVSRLVILRALSRGWSTALNVSRFIENPAGYVGLKHVDNSTPQWAYSVEVLDHRPDGKKVFTLGLGWVVTKGDTDVLAIVVTWDGAVGRYREFSVNAEPAGFQSELKK